MSRRLQPDDQAAALLHHARSATPFCSPDGEPCASIPTSIDARHVLPLRSAAFRDWITANYYSEHESAPSPAALRSALRTLEARARYGDLPAQKVDRRLSFEGDAFVPSKIILDLANTAGETLEITSRGWTIAENLKHSFFRSPAALPLPRPSQPSDAGHNSLALFADLFRLTGAERARVLVWLAAALRPLGPYPILVIQGAMASGKTTLARALRALIDPSTAPVRRMPERDTDLDQLARRNWILAFDPVRRLPTRISEALCALSSGEAVDFAQPDHRDPLVFEFARPIILVTPTDERRGGWARSHALTNRTLTVSLPQLAAPSRKSDLWGAFEALRPAALGGLATAVSAALHNIRDTDIGNINRLPDCAAWAAAAAPALGLEQTGIIEAVSDSHSAAALTRG
ncbi:MAG TPA: hypothetical protein VMH80_26875 [Bryobacteraceae bacterium]|nr:hypothetical protein [Bryobacteraceae bacterium]